MRLTVKSEYAVLALIDLARSGGDTPAAAPVSAREIAERQSIPSRFLEQVFASLRRAGIVDAVRGARGGFVLSRPAAAVTVLEVVEAVEGPLRPTVCESLRGDACVRTGICAAGGVWDRASRALKDVLGSATLADLASEQAALDSTAARAASTPKTGA